MMSVGESKNVLEKISIWLENTDFSLFSNEELSKILYDKFLELNIFDLDLKSIREKNLSLSFVVGHTRETTLSRMFNALDDQDKINLLLHNPNIIQFAYYVDLMNETDTPFHTIYNLLDTWNQNDQPKKNAIRSLELIEAALSYSFVLSYSDGTYYDRLFDIYAAIISSLTIQEEDKEEADQLLKRIADLLLRIKRMQENQEGRSFIPLHVFVPIFEKISNDDDDKINLVCDALNGTEWNDQTVISAIDAIHELDKKIAVIKIILNLGRTVDEDVFVSYSLDSTFEKAQINSIEEFQHFLSKLREWRSDEIFRQRIDDWTLVSLFRSMRGKDSLLQEAFSLVSSDPSFSQLITKRFVENFISLLHDDSLKIQLIKEHIRNHTISYPGVREIITIRVRDKSLLLDKELIEYILSNPENDITIAELIYGEVLNRDCFKNFESKFLEEGNIDALIDWYKKIGPIDQETIEKMLTIASKYDRNMTMDDMFNKTADNPNVKQILQNIAMNCRRDIRVALPDGTRDSYYNNAFKKLETLYSKTRMGSLPNLAVFKRLNTEMCEKFDVTTWNRLLQNPLFDHNDETKQALVEIIAMAGLFEDDPYAETRRKQVIDLFSRLEYPISEDDIKRVIDTEDKGFIDSHFDAVTIKEYRLRKGVSIPDDMEQKLSNTLIESQMNRIRRKTGTSGSEVTKFLSPYLQTENGWVLRHGINITPFANYLKREMTNKEYQEVLTSPNTPVTVINFLNPYEEVTKTGYVVKKDLPAEERKKVEKMIFSSTLDHRYTFDTIHSLFDGLVLEYDPDFYQFFLDNQDLILASPYNRSFFKEVRKSFKKIKRYYAEHGGNMNPDYEDMVEFIESGNIVPAFGNEEFLQDFKNSTYNRSNYEAYEKLLEITRKRTTTTVPRHEKIYEYVAPDGTKYQVMVKVLRADDPFNLLVGESKLTDCCQKIGGEGHKCLEHAATSQNGGILATYLIVDGVPSMLTQSWFWTNESKACLDNVEATGLIKKASRKKKELYKEIATFGIRKACEDIMVSSREQLNAYIEEKASIIRNSSLSDEEKEEALKNLEIIRQRQTLKMITVGGGWDDLDVKHSFPEIEPPERSYGPKGYTGYRDSTGDEWHRQHIILQTDEDILPPDPKYVEVPIYRDERRIEYESGEDIRYYTLKRIADMESESHKDQMVQYKDENGRYIIKRPEILARLSGCYLNELRVILGEDWYYVYTDNSAEIEVVDLAKTEPRLPDEGMKQNMEIKKGFDRILYDSVVVSENGDVRVKPIKANLREDTSYLLYLLQLKRGILEQVGNDVAFPFGGSSYHGTVVSKEEQEQIFRNHREIKEKNNPNNIMHHVTFQLTEAEVQRIKTIKMEEMNQKGRAM